MTCASSYAVEKKAWSKRSDLHLLAVTGAYGSAFLSPCFPIFKSDNADKAHGTKVGYLKKWTLLPSQFGSVVVLWRQDRGTDQIW